MQVEQHRLKCWLANAAYSTEVSRNNGAAPVSGSGFEHGGDRLSSRHLESTVSLKPID